MKQQSLKYLLVGPLQKSLPTADLQKKVKQKFRIATFVADSFPVLVHCKTNLYFLTLSSIESLEFPLLNLPLFKGALEKGECF